MYTVRFDAIQCDYKPIPKHRVIYAEDPANVIEWYAAITQSIIALAEALTTDGTPSVVPGGDPNKTTTVERLLNLWPGRAKIATK